MGGPGDGAAGDGGSGWPPALPETPRSRLRRWLFNVFPAYWCTGARITHLSGDFRELRLRLPLGLRTRNYVGTIFGGSMFAAVDPIHMVMLMENLGEGYVVWDKSACIRYLKPGRDTLYARFFLPQEELREIRGALEREPTVERSYVTELVDARGVAHARVEQVVHIRRKDGEEKG